MDTTTINTKTDRGSDMNLHVIGSSSAGNSYVLQNEGAALILECGAPFSKVRKIVGNVKKIVGALITHEHLDHSKYVEQYLSRGIPVFSGAGTIKEMTKRLKKKYWAAMFRKCTGESRFNLNGFGIVPFPVEHDVAEPYGFFIGHPETGRILFFTDTHKMNYGFSKVNNMIIEANYCEFLLSGNVSEGSISSSLADRIRNSHMSIQKLQRFIEQTDLSMVNNIVLVHLSNANSDARLFQKIIGNMTGKTVHVADKNMVININKVPF